MPGLDRLLRPRSIAVIGGGVWCRNVRAELDKIGFSGPVWHVHPREGFTRLADLPGIPDAAYIGVNREATVDIVGALAQMGAGGAVCFASGFAEARFELTDAGDLQAALLRAAGDMPILGPNCYGLLNYFDRAALWPDQHGGVPVARGVGLITQSSNMAINLTMQKRGLPIGMVVTAGNQAQQSITDIGTALLEDPRITALGLHVEGVRDTAALHALAQTAKALGKPVIVLKVGASDAAQAATISHTASLAGSFAGARALFTRLGFAQVRTLEGFLEALKIAHLHGHLASPRLASLSSSGGEASLIADLALRYGVQFPDLGVAQRTALRAALGPKVALANPLDYHTYIWGDVAAMTDAFSAMMLGDVSLGLVILDLPRADRCDPDAWGPALQAVRATQERSGKPMAVLASIADTMPEDLACDLIGQGVLPLCGLSAALEAVAAMAGPDRLASPPLVPRPERAACETRIVAEPEAKARLAACGISVPIGAQVCRAEIAKGAFDWPHGWPVVAKSIGAAHKSDAGGVVLDIRDAEALRGAAQGLPGAAIWVETMQRSAIVELLVGVVNDPVHGLVLILGRGGLETELINDSLQSLLPVTADEVAGLLSGLRMAPMLHGYRGRPAVDMDALVATILAVQDFVCANPGILEVEINPLLCLPRGCVAVDALMREGQE